MSAPETNIDKQASRHRGPLTGMAAVVIFALLLLAGYIAWTVGGADAPDGAEVQIDGRTGAPVVSDQPAVTSDSAPLAEGTTAIGDDVTDPEAAAPALETVPADDAPAAAPEGN